MGTKWWGYLNTNGKLYVKRYFDEGDIREAQASDFVAHVFNPIDAYDRKHAESIFFSRMKERHSSASDA